MEEVYILKSKLNSWMGELFNKDIISIDDLLTKIEDLHDELEYTKEQYEDYKEHVKENYRQITTAEMIGEHEANYL